MFLIITVEKEVYYVHEVSDELFVKADNSLLTIISPEEMLYYRDSEWIEYTEYDY